MDKADKDYDFDKLGTVLAVANNMNKEMLDMLKKQQERQVRMIWASLAIVLVACITVGIGMFCTYQSFESMNESLSQHIRVMEGQSYETNKEDSETLST